MTKTLIIVLSLFIYINSNAQNNKNLFAGIILDQITKTPVGGATIQFRNTNKLSMSNEEGRFFINNHTKTDSLNISAIGYRQKIYSVQEVLEQKIIFLDKQDVLLKEVVIAGRSNPTQIVSKLDVKLKGINNSQEALRIVPGLFIGQHAGGGKAEQIFLRGFDIDHGTDINITVDGMPVNMVSHAHGQGYADLHFVIPELLQDVQFKKGTYEPSKGNFTTAGFVDFRTKSQIEKNTIKIEAGQFNTLRNVLMFNLINKKHQNKSWFVASEYMYSKGYFDHPQNFHRLNLFTKYNTELGAKNNFTFTASTFKSKWNASGQIPDRSVSSGDISFYGAIDPNEGGNTSRTNINLQLTTILNNSSYLKNQLFYTYYDFDLYSNFTFFLNDPVNGDQIKQKEKRNLFGYNSSYNNVQFLNTRKLTSDIGMNVRFDRIDNIELTKTKNRENNLERLQYGDIRDLNLGVYVNETVKWNEIFTFSAGARVDVLNIAYEDKLNDIVSRTTATIVSPKVNVFIHPNEKMEIYASLGKGFHSNDTRVVLNTNKQILPAAYGSDVGINFKLSKNIFINAAVWSLFLDQEFIYVGDEGIVEPSGKTIRKGIDLSIRYQPLKRLFIDADINYAYARAKDEPKGNDFLPLAPMFTSSSGVGYKHENGFSFNTRYRFISDRPANEDNSIIAKGYFITDVTTGYTNKTFDINVSVQNIFNTKWKETQFATESRLQNEISPITEIHFTPGTPLFVKASFSYFF